MSDQKISRLLKKPEFTPSKEQISDTEKSLNITLPVIVTFLARKYNGAYFKSSAYYLKKKGVTIYLERVYDYYAERYEKLKFFVGEYNLNYFPLFLTQCGNYIVCNRSGEIFFIDHDVHPEWVENSVEYLYNNFNVLVDSFEEEIDPDYIFEIVTSLAELEKFKKSEICHKLAMYGNLPLFKEAYEKGYEVEDPMRVAAMNGHFEIVQYLLDKGVDPYEPQKIDGQTILKWLEWKPEYHEKFKSLITERSN